MKAIQQGRTARNEAYEADAVAVEQARQGKAEAFQFLVERYFATTCAVAQAELQDRELAEEVAQDSFLRAYLALDQLKQPRYFALWIHRISRNLAVQWRRSNVRKSRIIPMVSMDEANPDEVADRRSPSPRQQMESLEEEKQLSAALEQLPPPLREVVLLHFSEDMTQAEIARRLGVNRSSVNRRLERALAELRLLLGADLSPSAPGLWNSQSRQAAVRTGLLIAAVAAAPAASRAALAAAAGPIPALAAVAATSGSGWSALSWTGVNVSAGKVALALLAAIAVTGAVAVGQGWRPAFSGQQVAAGRAQFAQSVGQPGRMVTADFSRPSAAAASRSPRSRTGAVAGDQAASGLPSFTSQPDPSDLDLIIESTPGGKNRDLYSEQATIGSWQDSAASDINEQSHAAGLTTTTRVGSRVYPLPAEGSGAVASASGTDVPATSEPLAVARFTPRLQSPERYHVYITWPAAANAAPVICTIHHARGTTEKRLLQDGQGAETRGNGNVWISMGEFDFSTAAGQGVELALAPEAIPVDLDQPGRFYAGAVRFALQPLGGRFVLQEYASEDEAMVRSARDAARTGLPVEAHALIIPPGPDGVPFRDAGRWGKFYYREVARPGSIAGRVTDLEGRGVAGAKVVARLFFRGTHGNSVSAPAVVSDAAGLFVINDLPLGPYEVAASREGYAARKEIRTELTVGKTKASVDLKLRAGAVLSAIVVGPEGQPVADVRVQIRGVQTLSEEKPSHVSVPQLSTVTDQMGFFQFEVSRDGTYQLLLEPQALYAQQRVFDVPIGQPETRLRLTKGAQVSGHVYTVKEGARVPAAGHPVFAVTDKSLLNYLPDLQTVTDAQGRFAFTHLNTQMRGNGGYDSELVLRTWTLICQNEFQTVRPAERESLEGVVLTVKDPTSWRAEDWAVSGTVTDAQTRSPVDEFRVEMRNEQPGDDGSLFRNHHLARTGPGRYEVPRIAPYEALQLRILAPGYAPLLSPVFHGSAELRSWNAVLTPSPGFVGSVALSDGSPAAGAEIIMFGLKDLIVIRNGVFQRRSPFGRFVRAGADGRFRLEPQEEAFLLMVLDERGYAQVPSEAFADNGNQIRLQPWARLEGINLNEGRPGAGQEIRLESEYFLQSQTLGQNQIHWEYTTVTDAEGQFNFDRVLPGTVSVCRAVPMKFGEAGTLIHTSHARTVVAKGGKVARVTLGEGGAVLEGTLSWDWASRPDWSRAFVNVSRVQRRESEPGMLERLFPARFSPREKSEHEKRAGNYVSFVREDGTFRIDGVQPGEYRLRVEKSPDDQNSDTRYATIRVPDAPGETTASLNLGAIEYDQRGRPAGLRR